MRGRRLLASGVLVALWGALALSGMAKAQTTQPRFADYFVKRAAGFVRTTDTACAVISDTLEGPSVRCFGARKVIWIIQANFGTCSLMTVQVSNNDTAWSAAAGKALVDVQQDFIPGDSLNTGGVRVELRATDLANGSGDGIPYEFSRLFATLRDNKKSDGNPNLQNCRSRADSLRWKAFVQITAP